ncbi:MAG: hypothetical protein ACOYYS_24420 [Chloroflexota bacterium]
MMTILRTLFRISRPSMIVFAGLLYLLGVGIARYLGALLDGGLLLLGLLWVWITQTGAFFLIAYHDALVEIARTPRRQPDGGTTPDLTPASLLAAAAACLTVVASLSVLLIRFLGWEPGAFLLMLLMFAGAFFYAAPPRRLAASGYGELVAVVLLANLIPAFAFQLQLAGTLRLVAMSTFPLMALSLALVLVYELSTYANDVKNGRITLLIRMGWQRGMLLHNVFVLVAFVLLGLAAAMGMPFPIVWPTFLLIPLGVWQVWSVVRIAAGAKPNWRALTLGAQLLVGVMAYLLTYGFWIR